MAAQLRPWAVALFALFVPVFALAQVAAGTIDGAGANWRGMELYQAGGKLFVLDYTGTRVLVFNAATLASAGEIPFAPYAPEKPQSLAVHEGTGTLYVTKSAGFATSDTDIVVIDADTLAIGPVLADVGWDAYPVVDEERSRLYAVSTSEEMLRAFDINTHTSAGTLDLGALMTEGLMTFSREHLNPATGELFFGNLHEDQFLLVDGPAMTGQVITAANARGRVGTWNPPANKLYITTITWNGYFHYDRDTQTSGVTSCVNDGTSLFYSAASNRVYSGAEVNGDTTVIEADDSCQNVDVGGGLADVAFLTAMRRVFFAGASMVRAFDEDSLDPLTAVTNCGGGFGAVSTDILADETARRVYALASWSSPSQGSCIVAIDNPSLQIANASITEGDAGTKTLAFTVTMDTPVDEAITVDYSTGNGSAIAGEDFQTASGTLTFAAGQVAKNINVTIQGDTNCENHETFVVNLSNASEGIAIANAQATGTISDDDRPAAPTNVVATPNHATSIGVNWDAAAEAASYDVYRSSSGFAYTKIGSSGTTAYTDNTAASGVSYLYAVQTIDGTGCASPLSAPDLSTTIVFTDPAITAGTTKVKAAHVIELRSAVAAVRILAGLPAVSFTDPTLTPGVRIAKAVHIAELRSALDAARSALGLAALAYTNPTITAAPTSIKAAHIHELRNGVR